VRCGNDHLGEITLGTVLILTTFCAELVCHNTGSSNNSNHFEFQPILNKPEHFDPLRQQKAEIFTFTYEPRAGGSWRENPAYGFWVRKIPLRNPEHVEGWEQVPLRQDLYRRIVWVRQAQLLRRRREEHKAEHRTEQAFFGTILLSSF
jgi:hypothetical protein